MFSPLRCADMALRGFFPRRLSTSSSIFVDNTISRSEFSLWRDSLRFGVGVSSALYTILASSYLYHRFRAKSFEDAQFYPSEDSARGHHSLRSSLDVPVPIKQFFLTETSVLGASKLRNLMESALLSRFAAHSGPFHVPLLAQPRWRRATVDLCGRNLGTLTR